MFGNIAPRLPLARHQLPQWILANAPATVPIIIAAAASQTADLQEWQSNTGTVLSAVNAAGEFVQKTGAGAPVDTPANGAVYIDTTNNVFYFRSAATWWNLTGNATDVSAERSWMGI
jgi:hypothetical protein